MLKQIESETGFFKKNYVEFASKITDDQLETFSKLQTDKERFSFLYKMEGIDNMDIKLTTAKKNKDVALSFKQEGNTKFGKGHYQDALHLYSKCIVNTPWSEAENTRDISIALANRSAALYHLNEHNLALLDIHWISSLDYPKEFQYKIRERKARCFLATKQLENALQSFKEALSALSDSKLPLERKQKLQCDFQIMINLLSKKKDLKNEKQKDFLPEILSNGKNTHFEAASKSVIIKYSEDMGRFAEAATKISTGETILLEKAHCAVLLFEKTTTNCFQCFKRLRAPFPCPECCVVSFCSKNCQEIALKSHHKFECPVLEALWHSGCSITCLMALRIISQRNLKYFLNLQAKLQQDSSIGKYHTSNYLTVYNLVGHTEKRTPEDLLHRTCMATFLLRCLKATSFFSVEDMPTDATKRETEEFIGGLLLHHLQVLQFNAHEIFEFQSETNKSLFIGGGLYPTLALFNHSCNPAVARYFNGTSVVVRTVRPVAKGEMIGENYGPIFTQTRKEERQAALLKQYWFTCSCMPCVENWPLFVEMDPNILRFKCNGSKDGCQNVILLPVNSDRMIVPCSKCDTQTNILKGLKSLSDTDEMFKSARGQLTAHNVDGALKMFVKILNMLDENLAPPFRDYHICQQEIRKCMLSLGNKDFGGKNHDS